MPRLVHDQAATSSAAAACEVEAAVSWVQRFGDDDLLVVPRFDRWTVDGVVGRIHQEDGASALGITPDEIDAMLERGRAASSLGGLASVLARHGGDRLDLLRQVTVRVLAGDTDGHVQNHGFLHRGDGSVGLTPLYDDSPHGQRGATRLALRVNGIESLDDVTLDDVVAEALTWGVRRAVARGPLTLPSLSPRWRATARTLLRPAGDPQQPAPGRPPPRRRHAPA